ncbi:TetR/AcrR family transcriptional regulator [Gordonia sp. PKS22-38]|uniref:TetR/AcrR family transcriptional regulator n=1 Tax=Gordonia prachuapensis TaxID=3115651 RepID=A0ABU7MQ82_9ACTN|nr:TetR/AcrR family transcriptional regulator [Gordonia sp. PKS22-38]
MSTTGPERSYGGEAASDRVARRRAALIDAALTAMSESRWRSTTVAGLCSDAQLNKRYFYESFADLDAVAVAAIDDLSAQVADAAVAAYLDTLGRPLDVQARSAVDAIIGVLGTDRRKARVLLGGAAGTPVVDSRRTDAIVGLTAVLIEHARTIHDVRLEADSLAQTAPPFVVGGTAQAILAWADGSLAVTRGQLADDLTSLWLSLGASAAETARARMDSASVEGGD